MRNAKRELNTDDVVERIESKMKEKSISQRKMIHDLGLSPTSFTRWKYEGGKSYLKYMEQIADYLDVSTDYLLHGEEKIPPVRLNLARPQLIHRRFRYEA